LGLTAPYILFVGSLEPRKNVVPLVRAYRQIAPEVPHTLVLAGPDGWHVEDLDAELGRGGPGVVARMGIGYDDVRKLNQGVVYCSTSGYGQEGPRAKWAGHDLNYLAASGYLYCSGRRADGGPALPGATVADSAAGGMHAAIAILAALLRRKSTGLGEYLDVSVADGALQLMSLHIDRYLATGEEPAPGGDILTGRFACYDVYAGRDGKWLSVAAIEPAFFANLCRALGCEKWIDKQTDDASQEEIRAAFRHAFLDHGHSRLVSRDRDVGGLLHQSDLGRRFDHPAADGHGDRERPLRRGARPGPDGPSQRRGRARGHQGVA
jgi:crotonobetainyl-CoA:carnitine CoA-transferase CaiB-like acyl-CoA transferase